MNNAKNTRIRLHSLGWRVGGGRGGKDLYTIMFVKGFFLPTRLGITDKHTLLEFGLQFFILFFFFFSLCPFPFPFSFVP